MVHRIVEIDTLEQFDLMAHRNKRARGWRVGPVDLTQRGPELARLDLEGAVFLGTTLPEGGVDDARRRGALVFPALADVPFDAYRAVPYTPEDLYAGVLEGARYEDAPDGRIYQWYCENTALGTGESEASSLAMALHDHGMGEALASLAWDRQLVGVMGGHAAERGSADYAAAARLGFLLQESGFAVATGGGPGAMEAANLGAFVQPGGAAALDSALEAVSAVPSFRPSVSAWARAALRVRSDAAAAGVTGGRSLGIPTWFYGHEPPNAFATDIVKYFANAQREAILLEICSGGIVFLPGAGGTVQEVFQDACENYYASSAEAVNPMILVGTEYWTTTLPVWPLLSALAKGRPMEQAVFLVDSVDEAVGVLTDR
jgi:predicted Rossmann-fold nucleotide-binding protein